LAIVAINALISIEGRAFRHGDIENILENVAKVVGMAGSGGLLSMAKSLVEGSVGGGKTFSRSDVKHVYFVSVDHPSSVHLSNDA
jgi:hypothetical protein